MFKVIVAIGAAIFGFGIYNLIFESGNTHITSDWLVPIINVRYSSLTTHEAGMSEVGIGFAIIIIGVVVYYFQKRNR